MVSWQQMVSIAFDIAEAKGAQFDGIDDGARFMSELSEVWEEDKSTIKQMTRQQTRDYLQEIVTA